MHQSLIQDLLGFTLLAGLLTMLPGIDTAQVLRSIALGGKKAGYATVFGIMGGVWLWGVTAALGVSAILLASKVAYTIVKIVGALYLIYLGVKMIIESRHITEQSMAAKKAEHRSATKLMARAFVITVTNPKNGAFYVAILPTFLPHGMPAGLGGLLLASIHNALVLLWFTLLIFGASFAKKSLQKPQVQKYIERVSGVALIGFGVRVALERN
jgi:threonine/homoserine/homoserine lactone efflux protein